MTITDETLMAYADGELEEPARSEVERAIGADPALAARVVEHQALRNDVFAAFAPIAAEEVPARLAEAAGTHGAAGAADAAGAGSAEAAEAAGPAAAAAAAGPDKQAKRRKIAELRAPAPWLVKPPAEEPAAALPQPAAIPTRGATVTQATRASAARKGGASWAAWGGMAALLAVGVLAGRLLLGGGSDDQAVLTAAAGPDGTLRAQGPLADALDKQLAANPPSLAGVKIGASFASTDGALCRSFILHGAAGLACRSGGQWTLPVMAEAAPAAPGDYQQAGSAMPQAVLDAIDARIAGKTLDAAEEQAAQQRGWER